MQDIEWPKRLANAIIVQAVSDYIEGDDIRRTEVEVFLKSEYFELLSRETIDGEVLIAELKRRRTVKHGRIRKQV